VVIFPYVHFLNVEKVRHAARWKVHASSELLFLLVDSTIHWRAAAAEFCAFTVFYFLEKDQQGKLRMDDSRDTETLLAK
jgi:hypothetical protein